MNRRSYLQLSGAACLAAPFLARGAATADEFHFAFLTDIHLQPELGAGDGLKKCLAAVSALTPRPDFVITGGDLIMDSLATTRERIKVQWDLFDECWKQIEMPSHHTIGNHDVAGWSPKSPLLGTDADYGKSLFADRYGQGRTWRSFDHRGWHFIILDSIHRDEGTPSGFLGRIGDEQLEWLKNDLSKVGANTPVVVVTHIPFFSVIDQYKDDPRKELRKESLVVNAHDVRKVFEGHNVKLVLSGHGHVLERIEFCGISYIQGGSVCGAWWRGRLFGNPEGFGVVTCRADGSFGFDYRDYGWTPRK